MHIITEKRLKDFSIAHADSASSIRGWIRIVRNAKWQSIIDTRREWPSADPVGKFTIFNISGNKYRLVAYIDYTAKLVFVRHILTHEEYNKERWKKMTLGIDAAKSYAELLTAMQPRAIESEEQAEAVQRTIDELLDKSAELTPNERAFLALLGNLIYVWEAGRYELPDISGAQMVKVLLEEHGLPQAALVGPVFPTKGIASEVLSGKRKLTYEFVQKLAGYFHVSPAVFF